jgi:S1-C subfamily serine protease
MSGLPRQPVVLAVAGALGAATLLAACSGGTHRPSSSATTISLATAGSSTTGAPSAAASGAAALENAFVAVVNQVRPSVVEITTSTGLGSGVVFDANGDIVTNDHVVGTATSFQVTFFNGQTRPGTLVGTFVPGDLAVIKASVPPGVKPATFGDSGRLQVGDIALAIGNPLGLASSVTQGIVSFNGRTVPEGNGVVLPDTVQTSAPINPGNSGGALVDINGQVIGIPTLAATDPQLGGGSAPGIGFAIPSNTVKQIAGQLVASGKVTNSGRAALGISGATAVDATGNPVGVIVAQVAAGGAAGRAGIQRGDLITSVAGQPTPTLAVLQDVLAAEKPGASVPVKVTTASGATKTVTVSLGTLTG